MKKWTLALLLIIAIGPLVTPGLISAWLPGQIQQSLEERWPEATPLIQRGWFSTSVTARSPTEQLDLRFRHLPWWQGAWLSGSGSLQLTEPAARIELIGRFSGLGLLEIQASSTELRWSSTEPNAIVNLDLQFSSLRGRGLVSSATAQRMEFSDDLGNRIELLDTRIDSDWRWVDESSRAWYLTIDSQRTNHQSSQLAMQWSSIDAEASTQLMESLGQMNDAEPDSLQAQLAGLGLVSAWQQLLQAGLTMEHSTLNLDQQVQLQGEWRPHLGQLDLQGGGPNGTALDWMTPIIGLNQRISPDQARQQAWSIMALGEEQEILRIADEQFQWTANGASTP